MDISELSNVGSIGIAAAGVGVGARMLTVGAKIIVDIIKDYRSCNGGHCNDHPEMVRVLTEQGADIKYLRRQHEENKLSELTRLIGEVNRKLGEK